MERINLTAKCSKCLTCESYQYACQGVVSSLDAEKCGEYSEDLGAYNRQDRDDTYIPDAGIVQEQIKKSIEFQNQYKTEVRIFNKYDNNKHVATCYVTEVPKVNERISVSTDENYIVCEREMIIDTKTSNSTWNLYVRDRKRTLL